ncbi:hypothetical protein LX32DRAFT_299712 [Colletotrichum zoysiae]|uniref:Uncharacterized protein n=1 Tax=Colletotrichum zoysiae TaxID=1216348 RepID=A0AAD9HKW9_9PEZI|nr:hypothetical protein LX32DRAFT_299712 [Colletotrichum zoysiae]
MMFFISLVRPKNMRHGGKPGGRRELMVGWHPVAYGRLRKKSVGRSRNELAPAATRNQLRPDYGGSETTPAPFHSAPPLLSSPIHHGRRSPRAERGFVDKGWAPRSMAAWARRQRRHESTMALLKTKPAVKNVVFDINTPESVPNSSKERHLHTPPPDTDPSPSISQSWKCNNICRLKSNICLLVLD